MRPWTTANQKVVESQELDSTRVDSTREGALDAPLRVVELRGVAVGERLAAPAPSSASVYLPHARSAHTGTR